MFSKLLSTDKKGVYSTSFTVLDVSEFSGSKLSTKGLDILVSLFRSRLFFCDMSCFLCYCDIIPFEAGWFCGQCSSCCIHIICLCLLRIPVHPYRHDEYKRFITSAYPYYPASFSTVSLLFTMIA